MVSKILSTFCILVYALVVPYLEINNTHVFNPQWPSHARMHEVWQLITNSTFGILCLWYIWRKSAVDKANFLASLITGGFMVAYAIRATYGGSMLHSDGSERLIMGINIGVFGFGIVLLLTFLSQVFWNRDKLKRNSDL